ncbi:MAG: hypothetical protein M3R06_11230, partial [Chloroflexota bacterium]|nr:hypothetical protein [Chloroflexota bacterium]
MALRAAFALLLTATLAVMLLTGAVAARHETVLREILAPNTLDTTLTIASRNILDTFGEKPDLPPPPGSAPLPLCREIERVAAVRLAEAFGLMRGTEEGERLFQRLLFHDICVRVQTLSYNSGYSYAIRTANGSWDRSYIAVDEVHIQADQPDVLAALLVHEATHIDRAISRTSCAVTESCTTLPNGVLLEEEVAAHTAEAIWWIAAYGEDGKRLAVRYDHGLNELVDA